MSVSAWDTKVSMLLNLLLANIIILLCFFFLFLVTLSNFLIISVVKENAIVNPALAIPTGAQATVARETIQYKLLLLWLAKELKPYLFNQKQRHIYLIF